ncbi:hypothetical protein V8E36_006417 [Tilletia maclaganii]
MAGLDFFGVGPSRPTPAPSTAAASSSSKPRPGGPPSVISNGKLRKAGTGAGPSTIRDHVWSSSNSPALPPSPLRAPTPASTISSPRGAGSASSSAGSKGSATARPPALHRKVVSPSPSASPGPSSIPTVSTSTTTHRPAVVIVKTVTTKPRPSSSTHLPSTQSTANGSRFKYNALPEERRLRIAQEREQRLREQAEKQDAERRAAFAASSSSSSSPATRPLKKRRMTTTSSSEGKRKSPTQAGARRSQRARMTLSDEDEDDEDDDEELFGSKEATPRAARDSAVHEWVVPPRQPRDVTRPDEVEAVRLAANQPPTEADTAPPSHSHAVAAADHGAGIDSPQRSCRALSAMDVVNEAGIRIYAPYFKDIEDFTTIRLEYPAMHASETFPLLVPKSVDEYDPLSELLRTIHVMVSSYFPDAEVRTRLFGKLEELEPSGGRLLPRDRTGSGASPLPLTASMSGQITPLGSATANSLSPLTSSTSGASTPMRQASSSSAGGTGLEGGLSHRLTTPLPEAGAAGAGSTPTPASTPAPTASTTSESESILRSFQRARNRRNGPLFLRTVARFNETLRKAKREGLVLEGIRKMAESGIPEQLWHTIHEQCYSRVVGPKVEDLNRYMAFSDNVYGELLPRFSSEIAQLTGLGPSSVFVDMGSGVGNVLVQLALQTGCSAYGCEMMETPADLAEAQIKEARSRWAMWGLKGGEVEAWKDDFCASDEVRDVLRKADVVLVNNYAFTSSTNDKLVLQFLDLKDGCHVISLKPFVPPDFRLTERTLSSPLAILRVMERTYTSGCVSWGNSGGKYYIHTVDRKMVQDFRPSKTTRGETRKRRWKRNPEEDDDDMMSM